MNLSILLQIIGIFLYTFGSLLAIVELWKTLLLSKIKKWGIELDDSRRLLDSFYDFIDKYIGINKKDQKKKKQGMKYISENHRDVLIKINKLENKIGKNEKLVDKPVKIIKVGVALIVIGAVVQITGLVI